MVQKKHRAGAMVWITLLIIANGLSFLSYLLGGFALRTVVGYPLWAIVTLGILSGLNVVFAIGLLKWKKWGFQGLVGSALVSFGTNLSLPLHLGVVALGLVGPVLLWLFIRNEWDKYEWSTVFDLLEKRLSYTPAILRYGG